MLLSLKVDVNEEGGVYGSALQAACATGNASVVRLLLRVGANVNAPGGIFGHPLLAAYYKRNYSVIKILMDYGADISVLFHAVGDYFGLLQIACRDNSTEFFKTLTDLGVHVELTQDALDELLQSASVFGNVEAVKVLIELGANVNAQGGRDYDSALCAACAARGNNQDAIRLLLESGADINLGGEYSTALHKAASEGKGFLVEMLLDLNADVNALGPGRSNALIAASHNGREDVVRILLDSEARTETEDDYGCTPLFAASWNGYDKIVKLLVQRGGDPDHKNFMDGRTALSYAAEAGHQSVVEHLLADTRVDPHSKDSIGRPPLLFASKEGHVIIVDVLLRRDAPVNQSDRYHSTPLSMAARKGHTNVVESLLAAGATIDTRDGFGRTPVWWARRRAHTETVQLLLDAGNHQEICLDGEVVPDVDTRLDWPHTVGRRCDICTFIISGDCNYYYCPVCIRGYFNICTHCFQLGGRCLEESHGLSFIEKRPIEQWG